jgi:hypothetical protein
MQREGTPASDFLQAFMLCGVAVGISGAAYTWCGGQLMAAALFIIGLLSFGVGVGKTFQGMRSKRTNSDGEAARGSEDMGNIEEK